MLTSIIIFAFMANNYFQFRQFKIVQQHSAMKVGTDGVLLGAWTDVSDADTILDVGTGTGLIALMMAQRTAARITGVEIDKAAAAEAAGNVNNSPWTERISIENISFQNFVKSTGNRFGLIVSNPPFFTDSLKPGNKSRSIARHADMLPFSALIDGVVNILLPAGRFALILPYASAGEFTQLATDAGLYLTRITKVRPGGNKSPNRVLMQFSKEKLPVEEDVLSIYLNDGSDYTDRFKKLIRDFYLDDKKH